MTNTEWLRSRLLAYVDGDKCGDKSESLEELRETEWCTEFEQLMRNRLLMGRFRYGKMGDANKPQYNGIGAIKRHLREYERSGNLEHTVDIANYCLEEFVHRRHPKAHFEATDDVDHCEKI